MCIEYCYGLHLIAALFTDTAHPKEPDVSLLKDWGWEREVNILSPPSTSGKHTEMEPFC